MRHAHVRDLTPDPQEQSWRHQTITTASGADSTRRAEVTRPRPAPPPKWAIDAVDGRVLDPSTALVVQGVKPKLDGVRRAAAAVSSSVDFDGMSTCCTTSPPRSAGASRRRRDPRTADRRYGVRRVTLSVARATATLQPDGWTLLQQTRDQFGVRAVRGVGLDHIVFRGPIDWSHPFDWPATPSMEPPLPCQQPGGRAELVPGGYLCAYPEAGGANPSRTSARRRGAAPRDPSPPATGRGDSRHRLREAPLAGPCGDKDRHQQDGESIGYDHPVRRPRGVRRPDRPARRRHRPALAGHGTFIAGLVHQACPDADILSWRVVPARPARSSSRTG